MAPSLPNSATSAPLDKAGVVSRITTRAWRDENFAELLRTNAQAALIAEFGTVPDGFDNVTFRLQPADRVITKPTSSGLRLRARPKREDRPLNVVVRRFLGVGELVVVLYTKRCQYQCTFCTLPSTSAHGDVSLTGIRDQMAAALDAAGDQLSDVRQISLGNEGSILDERTLPREQLSYLLRACAALPAVENIILETRPEFATPSLLDELADLAAPKRISLKIGLESADDRIRQRVLGKNMDLQVFERTVYDLGRRGIDLASYVLVKADPRHCDAEGRADAIATCRYLKNLCQTSGIRLTLRVNAMYRAAGSRWAAWAKQSGWTPPSVFDLADVMYAVADAETPVYAGLSEEGLATPDGCMESRGDFQSWALRRLEDYNHSGDIALLRSVAHHRSRAGECSS